MEKVKTYHYYIILQFIFYAIIKLGLIFYAQNNYSFLDYQKNYEIFFLLPKSLSQFQQHPSGLFLSLISTPFFKELVIFSLLTLFLYPLIPAKFNSLKLIFINLLTVLVLSFFSIIANEYFTVFNNNFKPLESQWQFLICMIIILHWKTSLFPYVLPKLSWGQFLLLLLIIYWLIGEKWNLFLLLCKSIEFLVAGLVLFQIKKTNHS